MGLNSLGLGYTFTAKDLASGTIQRLRQSFTDLDKTSDEVANNIKSRLGKDMAKGAATGAIGAGSIALVNQAGKAYANYEESLAGAAMMTGTTKDRMGQLNDAIRKTNFDGLYTSKEAADAVAELGSAGLDAKQAMVALKPTMDLATVSMGRMGLADAANVGTTVLAAFGEETEKLTLRNAQLVVAAKETKFGFKDFETALRHAAPMAKTAGQEFESMIAYLGMMRDIGNDASTSATAYKEAVAALTTKSRTQNMFMQIGVDIFDKNTGKVRDMAAIMRDTIPIVEKMTDKDRIYFVKQALGSRGMKIYTGTVASYTKALKEGKVQQGDWIGRHTDLVAKLKSGQGEMSAQLDVYRSTSAYQRKEISKMWDEFKVSMGQSFLPAIMPVLRGLRSFTRSIVELANKNPELGRFIGKLMAFGGAALVVVGAIKVMYAAFGMLALGRYIAAQAAATAATTTTTTAMGAQSVAASRLGMVMRGLGMAAMAVGVAYMMRKEIVDVVTRGMDSLTGHDTRGAAAAIKYANAMETVNWKMGVAVARQEEYRDSLRKGTDAMVAAAMKSEKHADAALLQLSERNNAIRKQVDEQRKAEQAAKGAGDTKAEYEAKKKIFELENQSKVIKETELRISAQLARRQLGSEKDPTKRKELQGTIYTAEYGEYARKERAFQDAKTKKQSSIASMADPFAKGRMQVKSEEEWAEQEKALAGERDRLGKMAADIGLQKSGAKGLTARSRGEAAYQLDTKTGPGYRPLESMEKATPGVGAKNFGWFDKADDFLTRMVRGEKKWYVEEKQGPKAETAFASILDALGINQTVGGGTTVDGKGDPLGDLGKLGIQSMVEVQIKVLTDTLAENIVRANAATKGRNGKPVPRKT